jgi:hypothetical protein
MSSFKLILDIGLEFVPGRFGEVLTAGIGTYLIKMHISTHTQVSMTGFFLARIGALVLTRCFAHLDMIATAVKIASWVYPEDQNPVGAFEWWLSPCGSTDLVPEDIKRVFDILGAIGDAGTSYKPPKNIPKGSGRKGDPGNPTDRSKPRNPGTGSGSGTGTGTGTGKKCKLRANQMYKRLNNAIVKKSCDPNDVTKTEMFVITSVIYAANARATQVEGRCSKKWSQACYHYSSAIQRNPSWATLTCVQDAATTSKKREKKGGKATDAWSNGHKGAGWGTTSICHRDEYPPVYLLDDNSPAWTDGGTDKGQAIRYLPGVQNTGAAVMWKGKCFVPIVKALSDSEFRDAVAKGKVHVPPHNGDLTIMYAQVTLDRRPEFTITAWEQSPLPNDGLNDNPCWPKNLAPKDPGYALNKYDPWYQTNQHHYAYDQPYNPPSNGG